MSVASPFILSGAGAFDKSFVSPVLSVRGLTKAYGVVEALRDVSIDFYAGEVHAIVGENGAGKSTLTRLLGGEETPDSGSIQVDGKTVLLSHPSIAKRAGIALVHQQFQLVEAQTVAENICLDDPPLRWLGGILPLLDHAAMRRRAASQLAPFNMQNRANALIAELNIAERQVVEIARELAKHARLLILDEPTSALSAKETATLFNHVGRLRQQGVAILFIAHSLSEVLSIADRITVLRDGRLVTTIPAQAVDASALAQLIVGRHVDDHRGQSRKQDKPPILQLSVRSGAAKEATERIAIAPGEISGIPTYMGSAIREFLGRLSGERRGSPDSVKLRDKAIGHKAIAARVRSGISFVPGDATAEGLVPKLSIKDNILLPNLQRFTHFGFLPPWAGQGAVQELIASLDIRPPDPSVPVERLSGGNRQKVAIAKWLLAGADVLVMDDPARGIDVGAKRELYRVVDSHSAKGGVTVFASSDLDELLSLSDRLVILRGETVVAQLAERPFEKAKIVELLSGASAENSMNEVVHDAGE